MRLTFTSRHPRTNGGRPLVTSRLYARRTLNIESDEPCTPRQRLVLEQNQNMSGRAWLRMSQVNSCALQVLKGPRFCIYCLLCISTKKPSYAQIGKFTLGTFVRTHWQKMISVKMMSTYNKHTNILLTESKQNVRNRNIAQMWKFTLKYTHKKKIHIT